MVNMAVLLIVCKIFSSIEIEKRHCTVTVDP